MMSFSGSKVEQCSILGRVNEVIAQGQKLVIGFTFVCHMF